MITDGEDTVKDVIQKERYKLCPLCGNFVSFAGKDTFCIVCGTKLLEACPNCSEPVLYPVARFCPSCGQRLVKLPSSGVDRP